MSEVTADVVRAAASRLTSPLNALSVAAEQAVGLYRQHVAELRRGNDIAQAQLSANDTRIFQGIQEQRGQA